MNEMIEAGRIIELTNIQRLLEKKQSIMESKKNTAMEYGADFEMEYHLGRFEEARNINQILVEELKKLKLSFYESYPDYKDMLDEKLKAQALENRE